LAFGLAKIEWAGTISILAVCVIYFFIRLSLYYFSGSAVPEIHTEQFLFQATLPGLQEELLFRGILPGLLQKVFQHPVWKVWRLRFGWAALSTSILFGLSHGIGFNEDHTLYVNAFAFFRTAFDGLLLAVLTEKTKSIFPGVVYHNLLNLIGNH
jgi:membrane protease YdiL (CAAX protease family)